MARMTGRCAVFAGIPADRGTGPAGVPDRPPGPPEASDDGLATTSSADRSGMKTGCGGCGDLVWPPRMSPVIRWPFAAADRSVGRVKPDLTRTALPMALVFRGRAAVAGAESVRCTFPA